MKTIQSYIKSWPITFRNLALTSWIYLIYLAVALLLAIPFYRLFSAATADHVLGVSLLHDFSATAMGDLLRHDGKSFLFYIKGLWPWLIAFWLFGIFLYGSIISRVANARGRFSVRDCFAAGRAYFGRFIRLSVYVLITQLILLIASVLVFNLLTRGDGLTDAYLMKTFAVIAGVYLIFFITFSLVADVARFILYRENSRSKVLKSLWRSIVFVIRRWPAVWLLYLLWVLLPAGLIVLYYLVRPGIQIETTASILLLFAIQQAFIWLRFMFRIQKQAMLFQFYLRSQVLN